MGSVSLSNVNKSFGAVDVIHDVSLEIEDGEFCVLIGPSGSGKSTLLRIIAGLEEVTSGVVSIAGKDVTDLPPKQRDIAMVFQTYALYPQMTVAENMGFALKLAGMPKVEIAEKVKQTARMLELEPLLERLPKALSGGQRQRVSMGRAIVRDPSVFLFDEPLSNLDAKLRVQVRGEIADLHKRLGTTSIYVTHDQVEAMTLGQKIVVLRDGRVEQAGPPLKLYDDPVNTFVASFLGTPSINLIAAKVEGANGEAAARLADGTLLPLGSGHAFAPGQQILYGIRPEHVRVFEGRTEDGIGATIHAVENTGSDMVILSDADGFRMTAAFKEQRPLATGQDITIVPDPSKVRVFDAESGKRIRRSEDS
ncbi:sn-glycerol-3-phosphate ABC transporter ATP-binding protein UgpC [Martelella alba]|uniref:sn-glycerol-3-phosphate ABC transporter ATP-binding protein UgpC n=1 Tax=Martelella alba TaxID=2590451 RepID=A0A506U438_9HYPH|nr:sn-glycerol-3-phosphate ABC transporter ATP-binding protein UgpC [Martelella alba]TPW28218.1 sn-glycerol-3-phosphate ABC transporter ATP-binding protein UgpC [Martelella alba]